MCKTFSTIIQIFLNFIYFIRYSVTAKKVVSPLYGYICIVFMENECLSLKSMYRQKNYYKKGNYSCTKSYFKSKDRMTYLGLRLKGENFLFDC
jgi:hypothetical protein